VVWQESSAFFVTIYGIVKIDKNQLTRLRSRGFKARPLEGKIRVLISIESTPAVACDDHDSFKRILLFYYVRSYLVVRQNL